VLATNGEVWLGGGTSAAAPWWGGVWALATAMANRNRSGSRKPLGPAAPALYHIARETSCFHDITVGSNTCPWSSLWEGSTCDCTNCTGFEASAGWDPVTGLGTPNVSCILDYVANHLTTNLSQR
jgi:subtilase family serine protease